MKSSNTIEFRAVFIKNNSVDRDIITKYTEIQARVVTKLIKVKNPPVLVSK